MQTARPLLLNLGGPDSLDAVEPFLFNLFADPDIIGLPLGFLTQKPFALLVAPARTRGRATTTRPSAANRRCWKTRRTGAGAGTDAARARRLRRVRVHALLAPTHRCRGNRAQTARLCAGDHFSAALSAVFAHHHRQLGTMEFQRACTRQNYHPRTWTLVPRVVRACRLPAGDHREYSCRSAQAARPDPARIELLFSAHGLPKKLVERGDPYEQQIRATFEALLRASSAGRTPRSVTRAASGRSNGCGPISRT